jgi:hypothetical protein
MTKEFCELNVQVPHEQRHGRVFKFDGLQTRCPITAKRICRIVAAICGAAGGVVAIAEKRAKN